MSFGLQTTQSFALLSIARNGYVCGHLYTLEKVKVNLPLCLIN
jgi:hypothetical protein